MRTGFHSRGLLQSLQGWFGALLLLNVAIAQDDAPPRSLDPRLKIELFAEQPRIVTPTGIDVDHAGRVWAVESNTHFRPEDYQGHPSDRILVMRDTDGDHRADEIITFADGFKHTMSVAVRPVWLAEGGLKSERVEELKSKEGSDSSTLSPLNSSTLFIATRAALYLCRDIDGDLRCDERRQLVRLETPGDYPHNGLAGLAFDPLGWMYFGFGENLGAEYKLIGSDGTMLSGGGEGGNLYRCRPDGTKLERWATGFWNPHASGFDAFGRLFTVDNDPDSRPPCRLLHIIPGGDYGYRFRNGRKGLHPFTSWNGELPGTLPMVAGTGEAPSGLVAYESDGLPDDYLGTLLVTSWGDHRIDKFVLKPKGASFTSKAEPIIQGGDTFRPVGLALAPDGSLYCTDWVLKDYKLHGKGRVWRISAVEEPQREVIDAATITAKQSVAELKPLLESRRLDVRRRTASMLANSKEGLNLIASQSSNMKSPPRARAEIIWAILSLDAQTKTEVDLPTFGEAETIELVAKLFKEEGWDAPYWAQVYMEGKEVGPFEDHLLWSYAYRETHRALENEVLGVETPEGFFLMVFLLSRIKERDELLIDSLNRAESDRFIFAALTSAIAKGFSRDALRIAVSAETAKPSEKIAYLLTARSKFPQDKSLAEFGLKDSSPDVRRAAVQWIGEEKLQELRPQVEQLLTQGPMTQDLFLAVLASLSLLDGVPAAEFEKTPPAEYILKIVTEERKPAALRAQALRMLSPNEKALDARLLGQLLADDDPTLKLEAVRTLQHSPILQREELLRPIAADERLDVNLRAEAIVGLASPEMASATRELLTRLARSENAVIREESQRSLRGPVEGTVGLRRPLAEEYMSGGDVEAGRRVFYHANSAGCYKCHTINGRGGQVGPDLSVIARTMDRQKLAESILEPSKEISPQYTTWTLAMKDGQVHTGLILGENPDGTLRLGNANGEVLMLREADIEAREPQKVSLMPEKLIERLTVSEFRDLLAFLETLK